MNKKNHKKIKKGLDKPLKMWYNKGVKRKENRTADAEKKLKKSQKPLDKHHKMWYNKDTKDKDSLKHQKGIDNYGKQDY